MEALQRVAGEGGEEEGSVVVVEWVGNDVHGHDRLFLSVLCEP